MKAFKISAILSLIVAVVGLAGVVLLGSLQSYMQLVLGLLWFAITGFRNKRGTFLKGKVSDYLAGRILVFILLMFWGVAFVSPIIKGYEFQYPFQMNYLEKFGYKKDFFPEKLPQKVEDYEMEFMPSIMRGNGWTKVSFHTDPATIEQYMEGLAVKGCKEETLAGHNGLTLLEHHLPKQIKESIQECQIWVVHESGDWNHYRLSCVVVNEELGYVMFYEE